MNISKTPLRVSLFGGGSDFPSYFRAFGGAVIGGSIDRFIYCTLIRQDSGLFDYKIRLAYRQSEYVNSLVELKHRSAAAILDHCMLNENVEITITADLPSRVGLGSSSSFTVGLLKVASEFQGISYGPYALAEKAIAIERELLQEPGGWQDQIFAAFGGFNFIRFSQDGSFTVDSLGSQASRLRDLEQHLMLYFTGVSRDAGSVEQAKVDQMSSISDSLTAIKDHAHRALDTFMSDRNLEAIGRLLHETWLTKRSLARSVSTPHVDQMYDRALAAGALGGKLLGAGAGGFLLLFSPLDKVSAVQAAMQPHTQVPFSFVDQGSTLYQI